MADLKAHLEELGWEGIQTYIQSGNIIFRSTDDNPGHLAQAIKQKLQDKYAEKDEKGNFITETEIVNGQEIEKPVFGKNEEKVNKEFDDLVSKEIEITSSPLTKSLLTQYKIKPFVISLLREFNFVVETENKC